MFSRRPAVWVSANVVWASSETVLGLPFDKPPPYIPVDEEYDGRPETVYSLSKHLGEEMAREYCRWDSSMKIIGLRFSNVMEPEDYDRFPSFEDDKGSRRWNLWAYIDARGRCAGGSQIAQVQGDWSRHLHHRQQRRRDDHPE